VIVLSSILHRRMIFEATLDGVTLDGVTNSLIMSIDLQDGDLYRLQLVMSSY
jgi:hypothetical protein